MKPLFVMVISTLPLLAPGVSWAQNSNMMGDGTWGTGSMGGYGWMWMPILLVIVVALVAWIARRDK